MEPNTHFGHKMQQAEREEEQEEECEEHEEQKEEEEEEEENLQHNREENGLDAENELILSKERDDDQQNNFPRSAVHELNKFIQPSLVGIQSALLTTVMENHISPKVLSLLAQPPLRIETLRDLLQCPQIAVCRHTKLSVPFVQSLYLEASRCLLQAGGGDPLTPITALNLKAVQRAAERLCFSCPLLTKFFDGGLRSGGIIEISGEAGTGKTQFCLELLLQACGSKEKKGLQAAAFYCPTTESQSFDRLKQLAIAKGYDENSNDYPLNHIFVEQIDRIDKLWYLLNNRLPILLQNHTRTLQLLVIDSISNLIRTEYDQSEAPEKARVLSLQSQRLRELAQQYNLFIVVTNGVTDLFSQDHMEERLSGTTCIVPALGLAWSSCINDRILLTRSRNENDSVWVQVDSFNNGPNPASDDTAKVQQKKLKVDHATNSPNVIRVPLRTMHILMSSWLPRRSCHWIVEPGGIKGT